MSDIYPPQEMIIAWDDEWESHVHTHADEDYPSLERFMVQKACDWQRQRDATTCELTAKRMREMYGDSDLGKEKAMSIIVTANHIMNGGFTE